MPTYARTNGNSKSEWNKRIFPLHQIKTYWFVNLKRLTSEKYGTIKQEKAKKDINIIIFIRTRQVYKYKYAKCAMK